MAVPFPYFYCKHCAMRIAFPFPIPQETEEYHPRLPKGTWQIYVLCSHCEQTFLCKAEDIRLARTVQIGGLVPARPRSRRNDYFYRVEHKCGWINCGVPHVLFVHSTTYLTENSAAEKARNATPPPECANGHNCDSACQLVDVREVFSLLN